jgi:hypothetical protein
MIIFILSLFSFIGLFNLKLFSLTLLVYIRCFLCIGSKTLSSFSQLKFKSVSYKLLICI